MAKGGYGPQIGKRYFTFQVSLVIVELRWIRIWIETSLNVSQSLRETEGTLETWTFRTV